VEDDNRDGERRRRIQCAAALDGAGAVAALAPAPAAALAPAPAALVAVAALLPVVPVAAVGLAGLGAPVAGAPMIPNVQVRNNLMALQQQRDATIARERTMRTMRN
jgi:hypothetical protein